MTALGPLDFCHERIVLSPLWAARTWAALTPELQILGPPLPRAERQSHLGARRPEQRWSREPREAGPLSTWMHLCLPKGLASPGPSTDCSQQIPSQLRLVWIEFPPCANVKGPNKTQFGGQGGAWGPKGFTELLASIMASTQLHDLAGLPGKTRVTKEWTKLMGPGHKLLKCPSQSTKPRAGPQSGVTTRLPVPGNWWGLVSLSLSFTRNFCALDSIPGPVST